MFDIIVDINRYQFLQQMTNIKFKLTIFSKYVGNFKTLSRTIKTKKKKKKTKIHNQIWPDESIHQSKTFIIHQITNWFAGESSLRNKKKPQILLRFWTSPAPADPVNPTNLPRTTPTSINHPPWQPNTKTNPINSPWKKRKKGGSLRSLPPNNRKRFRR